ncbi:hypothetical protein GGS21DRAFT_503872 [Xylaria nigripes]|nr:hypothetical protein GGS21DRAFT_503872 [Xylaria nigripes]
MAISALSIPSFWLTLRVRLRAWSTRVARQSTGRRGESSARGDQSVGDWFVRHCDRSCQSRRGSNRCRINRSPDQ